MAKYVLGLDIGITSVGWGIIDLETGEVIDYGVRLFKESDASNNIKRRNKRGSKRLKQRKTQRIEDFIDLLIEEKITSNKEIDFEKNPYEVRVKGLNSKLNNEELIIALYNIVKRRGSGLEIVEDAPTDDEKSAKAALAENDKLIKEGKYICEIQLDRLLNNNKLRGVNNNFKTKDYVKEAKRILSNQDVSDHFKSEFVKLVQRRRQYYEGPGSQKSPSIYGRYIDFNQEEPIDLIEKMRGKCSVYKDEPRAPKSSFTANLFNLLNDLNNITININEKITLEQKKQIIEIIKDKGSITPKQLAKFLEVDFELLSGFRIDTKENPILTTFDGYKQIKKVLSESELYLNTDLVDSITEVLTRTKGLEERKELISKLSSEFTENEINSLSLLTKITGYHSLSFKAMKEIIEEMMYSDMNQMQIITLKYNKNSNFEKYKGKVNIFADDEAILSPVAKRSQRETMKVVNKLRKIYGEFDSIVVETTRSKNSAEEKARISKLQENNKKLYDDASNLLEEANSNAKLTLKLRDKLRLYEEQSGKTAYELHPIDIKKLIEDSTAYEIDHIIPISISSDDSYANKVLVTREENQNKGNMTPLVAFNNGKFKNNKEVFIANTLNNRKNHGKIYEKKKQYLLYEKDITKFDNMKEFINRNLVDTSYASRVVLNTLQDYFIANNIPTKVHTIRGSTTHMFRKRVKIEKDRDSETVGYAHHAIDALIIASLKKFPRLNFLLSKYKGIDIVNKETGEIIDIIPDEDYFESKYIQFVSKLMSLEKNVVKFSHKIDTKPNRQVADETIYSTRLSNGNHKVIKKYKNIYSAKELNIANDILENNFEKYLMYHNDINTFNKIVQIVQHYKEVFFDNNKVFDKTKNKFKINPLSLYFEEHNKKITKYSKKNKGSEITQIKYIENNLGNHIDISKNYNVSDKKVVLLQISPYRTDFYYSKKHGYKFVTIRYSDIHYKSKDKEYCINEVWYNEQKSTKSIDDSFKFCFSLHRDELIKIIKTGESDEVVPIMKFTATNDDIRNIIELKPVHYYEPARIRETIGRKIVLIEKYATDVCGNLYKVPNQELKLKFK